MAVRVKTDDPTFLLKRLRASVRRGDFDEWEIEEGALLYVGPYWGNRAWFLPSVREVSLVFNIISAGKRKVGATTYGIYHSRLIELLLTEFDTYFTSVEATALATADDEL